MPFVLPLLPALAEAAPIIALIFAGVLILKMIGGLLPKLGPFPLIGSIDFGAPFVAAANAVEGWIVSNTKHLWFAVTHWIGGLAYDGYHNISSALAAAAHLSDQIAHIVTHSIPQAIGQATTDAVRYVDTHVGNVLKTLHGTAVMLERLITVALNSAKADVAEVRQTVNQIVRPALATAESDLAKLDHAVFGTLETGVQGLEQTVSSLAHTVEIALGTGAGSIEQEIGAAIGAAGTLAGKALKDAVGTLTGDIADVAGIANEALNGAAGTLLGTVAATAAAALALATKLEGCAVTKCAGPNNLSGLLNDLAGAADYAAIAAFIKTAIDNPASAAHTFEQGAVGLYDTGSGLLNSLLAL